MDQIITPLASKMSDYGGLVMLGFAVILGLALFAWYQTKRLALYADRVLDVVAANTGLMSKISTQIEVISRGKN